MPTHRWRGQRPFLPEHVGTYQSNRPNQHLIDVADRECHELGKPDKGNVMLTGRLFADRAIYTCDEGYRLVGVEFRLCQADGSWSATEPSCHKNGKLSFISSDLFIIGRQFGFHVPSFGFAYLFLNYYYHYYYYYYLK